MNSIEDKIIKIAAKNKSFMDWENNLPDNVKEERELIRRVQDNNDKFAFKKLNMKFQGVMVDSIKRSGILNEMDLPSAKIYAAGSFRKIINDKFDLSKKNKPSSYITDTLTKNLKNTRYDVSGDLVDKTGELSRKEGYMSIATGVLRKELGREPNDNEIFDYITKVMKVGITMNNIRRINNIKRDEYSGDKIIGKSSDSSAEEISMLDIKAVGSTKPEDIINDRLIEDKIEKAAKDLQDKRERVFVRKYFRIGEFKNVPNLKGVSSAALYAGISTYKAQQVLKKISSKIQ